MAATSALACLSGLPVSRVSSSASTRSSASIRAGEARQRLGAHVRRAPLVLDRERAVGVLDHLAHLLGGRLRQLGELVPGGRVDGHEAAHRSRPPSTLKTAPVIALASSEAR